MGLPSVFRVLGVVGALLLASLGAARAQAPLLRDVTLRTDTASYQLSRHTVIVQGEPTLFFWFRRDDETVEVRFYPEKLAGDEPLRLRKSTDFQQLDSLTREADGAWRTRIKFQDLTSSQFIRLVVEQRGAPGDEPLRDVVPLLPVAYTSVNLRGSDDELFVGEEKVLALNSSNPRNVRVTGEWVRTEEFDYQVTREPNGTLRLHVLPKQLGRRTLTVKLQSERPMLQSGGRLNYQLPALKQEFVVKASRLRFLTPDKRMVTLDENSRRRGVELILDNGRAFDLRRTYRVEDQEEPGGALIAELFTRQYLTNDRVLCFLRPYNTHRQTEGYLYLKQNDQALYVTNLDITPKTTISSVQVLHRGGDWTSSLNVSPGETVDVRLEGEGLQKARFHFEDLPVIPSDSSIRTDSRVVLRVQVPVTFDKRRSNILNAGQATGQALSIREFQRPHPLDFVSVSYGDASHPITRLNGPVLFERTVRDVVFSFNPNGIDTDKVFYGKQLLSFEIRTLNSKGELVEIRNVDNVVICPGDNSPRAVFYQDKACRTDALSLNALLSRKTYDLDDWSRIIVTVKHQAGQYSDPGFTQTVELVLKRNYKFDIDISFPAGLLTRRIGEPNGSYTSFGGISLATLAQFSFYHPEKINRLRPYKVGAGFVALNAFNLNPDNNANRDLGIVVLGSVYPTRRDAKLTFPLYLGGGYLLNGVKSVATGKSYHWFVLFGPGIGVRL
ncbi:hypothetical protein EJV47_17505 [Hymenobacter gummosus]|uniref:Uncharacterized protein n=1 Tax=Hymenobacter gummosus TaxID=1776032 RepID=A0A431U0I4_9BACT|nr:hypothetical protein [Hymenobacter gummosus]RTQ48224.1 hypothetical protein EJV47_17505 [Hymenobacter gummosus]